MMKTLLAMVVVVVAVAACEPPPAWQPGDAPLSFYAPDDRVWAAIEAGCAAWEMTGLRCKRSTHHEATVHARIGDPTVATASAQTLYRLQTDVDMSFEWGYFIILSEESMSKFAVQDASHEIGHLLGMWEHVEDGPALMSAPTTSEVPTTVDLDALERVWGDAPWAQ